MKVNWFSPLPPAQSGVAAVCGHALPALARAVELTLWTDQERWDPSLEEHAPVRHYRPEAPPWNVLESASLNLYALGSNVTFHEGMWQVLRRLPGAVVLHDPVIFELIAELYLTRRSDQAGFLALLERYYGAQGRTDGEAFLARRLPFGAMMSRYPCTAAALDGALGGIVHSDAAFRMMGALPDVPIVSVPMPYRAVLRAGTGRRPPNRQPPYRLIIFGHLGENRRLVQILAALAEHPRRSELRLDVYGTIANFEQVRAEIARLGLGRTVNLRGYVAESQLRPALECADLSINLRHPTRGEASHSQLMIWEHALPTLVTRADWCASLPGDTVAFVRPDHEAEDLRDRLTAFLDHPDRFAELGRRGRARLEKRHQPSAFVAAVVDFATRAGVRSASNRPPPTPE